MSPYRPRSRRAGLGAPADDGELLLTGEGWACPACGRSFRVFYGTAPGRRCLDCWVAENPDDPFTRRLAEETAAAEEAGWEIDTREAFDPEPF